MRGSRERVADVIAGQSGRQQRKAFVRSLKETAVRAVVTASVTFAVGLVLKRLFEQSVSEAAKEGAKDGVDEQVAEVTGEATEGASATDNAPLPTGARAQPGAGVEADTASI
ncbi:hypothetical protein ACFOWT_03950 [Croceibacterium xixiisoli]|uniref:hypothetical protein n=1 Tax=Croceibacterium xixiisoli TaxID=1476466 RepID=UPI001F17EAFF|nr:hypothetical protein [Croceibacterium xixiisoli]